jgi:UDP-N-acetylmuramoyl-L-alanyl-D-glutamate--2,6-diaminopimelate ligase
MQIVRANTKTAGPLVVIDYSHTPDALEKALKALREHCHGKLCCVFGCGGDRDRGKRPIMGRIAEQFSDHIVVTSDNPRSEDPEKILADVVSGLICPAKAKVEVDRSLAIHHAIKYADVSDVVLIAGKGHEDYQLIGKNKIPFSDYTKAKEALEAICFTG